MWEGPSRLGVGVRHLRRGGRSPSYVGTGASTVLALWVRWTSTRPGRTTVGPRQGRHSARPQSYRSLGPRTKDPVPNSQLRFPLTLMQSLDPSCRTGPFGPPTGSYSGGPLSSVVTGRDGVRRVVQGRPR